jgi:uncharacterized protein YodC (DUF2158 family)
MPEKFKTGDIVQHTSGGPEMVVRGPKWHDAGPYADDQIDCMWFDDEGAEIRGVFHEDELELKMTRMI